MAALAHYARELRAHNVVWRSPMAAPVGAGTSDRALMPEAAFRGTRPFREFLAPQDDHGLLTGKLVALGPVSGFVSIHRGGGSPGFDAAAADAAMPAQLPPPSARLGEGRWRSSRISTTSG